MMLERGFGREAFGDDPANYHAARPAYPAATWEALRERAGLGAAIEILEIGAGTGLATAPLLAHNTLRVVAIEPDVRLAGFLRTSLIDPRLQVIATDFEHADLPPAAFDLVASATAFHWLDAVPALKRIYDLLRPQGAIAIWWNVFGDDSRPDPFHEATTHLVVGHRPSPSAGMPGRSPQALDAELRLQELAEGGFRADPPQFLRWTLRLDPLGVRNLYGTYSNVTALPWEERRRLLDSLEEIAARQFGGQVDRNMTTAIYTAHRA